LLQLRGKYASIGTDVLFEYHTRDWFYFEKNIKKPHELTTVFKITSW